MSRLTGPMRSAAGLVLALTVGACASDIQPEPSTEPGSTIPQPVAPEDLELAPEGDRVDLALPTFTNPTEITNPLFPVSSQHSVLLLGTVDDLPFRTEVTLLPTTRIISWGGQQVEVLVSQYVAFLDGRLHEVAYDLYAQADDGSVWYFGEDVYNFADGAIVDTHGTWTAGVDGPAAMIMPGEPRVGDVYRPENIPGFVFEEVTVRAVDETLDGPLGPIEGGLLVEELHMEGAVEEKSFAPGYGEFFTEGDGDLEALALAVPTDAVDDPPPAELEAMTRAANEALDATAADEWAAAATAADALEAAWAAYQPTGVPRLIEPLLDETIRDLRTAIGDEQSLDARQSAIDAARLVLDLELRHQPVTEIDLARFGVWLSQLELDAGAEELAHVNGDYFALDYVRDRILHALDPADLVRINLALEELLGAIQEEDFEAVLEIVAGMRETLAASPAAP